MVRKALRGHQPGYGRQLTVVHITAELMKDVVFRNLQGLPFPLLVGIVKRGKLQVIKGGIDIGGKGFVDQGTRNMPCGR